MKPVNLLPERYRPARSTGKRSGSAYVVLGVLGGLLLVVFLLVNTSNQVADRETKIAEANQEAQAAEAKAGTLESYANFEKAKTERTQAVGSLANGRFDWERFMRELARVLPDEASIISAEASVAPAEGAAAAAAGAAPTGPTAMLNGCALSHPDVATLMVRLRQMDRVTDVKLAESAKGDDGGGGGEAAGGEGGEGGCGTLVTFDVTVVFDPLPPPPDVAGVANVPASLGGGQ